MTKKVTFLALATAVCFAGCQEQNKETEADNATEPVRAGNTQIVDLTHSFSEETVYWVTAKEFELEVVAKGQTDNGYYYSANNFATAEHGGTHIDAPIHFAEGRHTVEEIPLEKLIGEAIKVDVSKNALNNPDYLVSVEDFLEWEKKEGKQIPDGSIVLLHTGFASYYPDKVRYMGTSLRGFEAVKLLHFPGLDPEAATWLVKNRNIKSIGIDTPSIDYGQSKDFQSHVILLSENIPAFENLTNLDQLPSKGFEVVALPMKIKEGTGAPLRAVAILKN